MTRWAMVADLRRCVGCQTCTAACKQANGTPPGVQWRRVIDLEVGEYPAVKRAFVPVGCMHCDEPPCMAVCPSTATRKRADGIVTVDPDLCIGSGDCVRLLPDAFAIDESQGVAVPLAGAATTDPALLVKAASGCPTQAIRVRGADGTLLYGSESGS